MCVCVSRDAQPSIQVEFQAITYSAVVAIDLNCSCDRLKLVQQDNVPYLSIKKVKRDDDNSGSRESTSS